MLRSIRVVALLLVGTSLVLGAACSAPLAPRTAADKSTPPETGACYRLTPEQTRRPSSPEDPVPCTEEHTAQTFAIGTLPKETGTAYRSSRHGAWVHETCEKAFKKFLAVDESLAMRIQLDWVWFRPSERGWDDGARWYRCDVVGGRENGPRPLEAYAPLPKDAKGLFGRSLPEEWLTCARGETVSGAERVPCSDPHDWRAVSTIKLGEPDDPWLGERVAQVRTRNYCSDSVGAWMNYPVEYGFGYSTFGEAAWKAGNRRSVCWARIEK